MISVIYNKIGQRIVNSIDDNWQKAILHLEYIGSVKSTLEFIIDNKNKKTVRLNDSFQNMRDVKKLHEITTEGGNNKWNRAIFTITPDGEFDLEFIWDQKLQDEVESYN